jgi:thymidine kinase
MFSGKTEELLRRMKRAEIAGKKTAIIKNKIDTRSGVASISTHSGSVHNALPISNNPDHLWSLLALPQDNVEVVGFDEIQFFHPEAIPVIRDLVEKGTRVVAAGLDLDFRGEPFPVVAQLLALADDITKLQAICISCGENAHFTQRVLNGKPANYHDPVVLVGASESYKARCRSCFMIPGRPEFNPRMTSSNG